MYGKGFLDNMAEICMQIACKAVRRALFSVSSK